MTKRGKPEWQRFAVGEPSSRSNWTNPDCCPLESVFHVCHIDDAFRIFEDQEIRSSLIFDESKLRKTRTTVTWLSPNIWSAGSRYGNVSFEFKWKELIADKDFYWVEVINYSIPAVRILVTDRGNDRSGLGLALYDPTAGDGPIFFDSAKDTWYWNAQCTAEFMFDSVTFPLSQSAKLSFVDHHERFCNKRPPCRNLGKAGHEAGARLLARLIGQRLLPSEGVDLVRIFCEKRSKPRRLHYQAARAWEFVTRSIPFDKSRAGRVRAEDRAALDVAAAILDRFGTYRTTRALCNLFRSKQDLHSALIARAMRDLGLDSAERLSFSEVD